MYAEAVDLLLLIDLHYDTLKTNHVYMYISDWINEL